VKLLLKRLLLRRLMLGWRLVLWWLDHWRVRDVLSIERWFDFVGVVAVRVELAHAWV